MPLLHLRTGKQKKSRERGGEDGGDWVYFSSSMTKCTQLYAVMSTQHLEHSGQRTGDSDHSPPFSDTRNNTHISRQIWNMNVKSYWSENSRRVWMIHQQPEEEKQSGGCSGTAEMQSDIQHTLHWWMLVSTRPPSKPPRSWTLLLSQCCRQTLVVMSCQSQAWLFKLTSPFGWSFNPKSVSAWNLVGGNQPLMLAMRMPCVIMAIFKYWLV